MADRVAAVGGLWSLEARPGAGTRLSASVPAAAIASLGERGA
jgi:hypothetical protein